MAADLLALLVAVPVTLLPLPLQDLLGSLLGRIARALVPARVAVVRANLAVAFPERDAAGREALLAAHFTHLGRVAVDMLQQPLYRHVPSLIWRKVRPVGWHHLEEALAGGRSAILLCSHMGSWEASAAVATLPGVELLSVYKATKGFGNDFLLALRRGFPQHLLTKQDSKRELLRGARRGALLGLIADQGGLTKYPFFGRPAYFPDGPGHFWGKLGIPPVLCLSVRVPGGVYECHTVPLELPERESIPEADRRRVFVEAYIRALEGWVRDYPEQYYWVHDVWRIFKDD